MADSIQQTTIVGNVGRDPEAKQIGNSTVFSFTVAVNKSKKQQDGSWFKRTYWWTVDCWSQQVPFGLKKGAHVTVVGEFELAWDKDGKLIMNKDGMPMLKLRSDQFRVVVAREKSANAEGYNPAAASAPEAENAGPATLVDPDGGLDELPF